jgi:hypothetical protein
MVFGRSFEKALRAYFYREDCTAVLFKEWGQDHQGLGIPRSGEALPRNAPTGIDFAATELAHFKQPFEGSPVS